MESLKIVPGLWNYSRSPLSLDGMKQCGILQICMALVISAERRISSWRVFGHRVKSCSRSRATQSLSEQSQHLLFLGRSLVAKSELSASTCQKHGSLTSLRSNNSFK